MSSNDSELNALINQLRACCNSQLVAKVNKHYRIQCLNTTENGGNTVEFDLNLKDGSGWCEWTHCLQTPPSPDVIFTLQKSVLIAIVDGSQSSMSAYINGQVSIQGAISDAIGLKYLAERAKEIRVDGAI